MSTTNPPSPEVDDRFAGPGRSDDVLAVESLRVEFLSPEGRVPAVRDVDLRVGRGEVLGLVGESGSGKSVTSLAVMGLLPSPPAFVSARSIRLGETELTTMSRRSLSDIRGDRIAMIFQEPMSSLNPAYTVGNQIAETVRRHRDCNRTAAWAKAVEALDHVGIPLAARRARQYPHEFSGGMLQRAMIAMAISCEPELLIADEPTTALDVTVQAQVLDLLRSMQGETGMAILFITHDLGVVADICDRVSVMYAGEVVEEASVYETFASPVHPYTEGLLASMPQNMAPGHLSSAIPGSAPPPSALPSGCPFHPRCAHRVDECDQVAVELRDVGAGRRARCLLAESRAATVEVQP